MDKSTSARAVARRIYIIGCTLATLFMLAVVTSVWLLYPE